MQFRNLVLSTLLGATLFAAQPPARAASSEEALEASTAVVQLPSTPGGSLMIRQCSSCPAMIVRFDADSRFFLGKRQVTLPELNRFLAAGGTYGLTVFYRRGDRSITRVVVQP
jgi:hypothetical protein